MGIPLRAWLLRGDPPTQYSVPATSFQHPALLKSPALRGTATFAQALQSVPETQVSLLDNGLRVASEQSSHATCTVSGVPLSRGVLHSGPGVFPGLGVTLGLSSLWFGSDSCSFTAGLTLLPQPQLQPHLDFRGRGGNPHCSQHSFSI